MLEEAGLLLLPLGRFVSIDRGLGPRLLPPAIAASMAIFLAFF